MDGNDEELGKKVAAHDEAIDGLKQDVTEMKGMLANVQKTLTDLKVENAGRPTWAVTVFIGVMCTLVSGMATFIVTKL